MMRGIVDKGMRRLMKAIIGGKGGGC